MDRRRRDLLPSLAPTPVGDHQPTSLYRLPGGQEIYVYKNRDGVLVTDDIDGSTRRVDDVCREVRRARPIDSPLYYVAQQSSTQQQQANNHGAPFPLASRRRRRCNDLQNRPSPLPSPAPSPVGDRQPMSLFLLPNDQEIYVYEDMDGVLVTDDCRPVEDVCREVISIRQARPSDLPPLHADTKPNVLASKELIDTSTLKESSITNKSSLSQPTSPLKDELIPTPQLLQDLDRALVSANLFLTQPSDYAYHYWALEEPDMFSSNELFIAMATLGKSPITDASSTRAEVVTHSPTPPISARKPTGWYHQFFIRVDLDKVFHTYPKLGGPFRSLEEAETAILLHLDELHDPKMFTNEGLSSSEIAIRDALYWPDGKRKYPSRSNPDEDHMGLLVQALLDKYNEENTLSGDCAYQVENVVSFQEVYEGNAGWYYHLNCTRKTKGGVDILFFAEVSKMVTGELEEFELTCLHMLESVDNGTCYGCTSDYIGVKHPIGAGKYEGGHDPSWPRRSGSHSLDFAGVDRDDPLVFPKNVDAWMKAEEERIRFLFQDDDVAKSDAGRTPACSDMSQGRRLKCVVPAKDVDARMKAEKERITCLFRDNAVAKSNAGRTPACSDMRQRRRLKYVVPAKVDARIKTEEERITCVFRDDAVAKSDAGRTPACSDMSQGRRLKCVVPAKDVDARMKAEKERITCLFRDNAVAKSDAGRTPACSDMSQGRKVKYVVPAKVVASIKAEEERITCLFRDDYVAKSDAGRIPACSERLKYVVPARRQFV